MSNPNPVPILSETGAALCKVADELAAIASQVCRRARFGRDGTDTVILGKLQELQRTIEKYPSEDPCVRAAANWQAHLITAIDSLKREHYTDTVGEIFWQESRRLQAEFDKAVEKTSSPA